MNPQLTTADIDGEPVLSAGGVMPDVEQPEGVDAWSAAEAEAVATASIEESGPPVGEIALEAAVSARETRVGIIDQPDVDKPQAGDSRSAPATDSSNPVDNAAAESRPAEAHREGDKPQPYKLRRAAACAALFVAVVTTLLCFLLVIAAGTEDSAIEGHTGRADAEVLDVTTHRTLVRFQTPDGAEHVPNVGVLYPEALEEGQVVRVEYDLREPDLVRVAGRGATLTFLPAFTTLIAVWAVTVGLVWWLRKPGPLHLRSLRARRKPSV